MRIYASFHHLVGEAETWKRKERARVRGHVWLTVLFFTPFSLTWGEVGKDSTNSRCFLYEPRGPVSYPAQFFFWEDLQNSCYFSSHQLEMTGGA